MPVRNAEQAAALARAEANRLRLADEMERWIVSTPSQPVNTIGEVEEQARQSAFAANQPVGGELRIITEIARQTTLLALNAAYLSVLLLVD